MRDLNEENITDAVLATVEGASDPRMKRILSSLIRHAHAFVRDVELTESEWLSGISFLTRTGQLCTPSRQEFILLSDTLGITMLMDAINHRLQSVASENSVLGPFFLEQRPALENGSDISGGLMGQPMYFAGKVLDTENQPLVGAMVDVWHTDADGHYDVDIAGLEDSAMRATFHTDDEGRFYFHSIVPQFYPIPTDGTVGEMLAAAGRSAMRPAHIHVMIDAPGYHRVTSTIFLEGDLYLDNDAVFGVKASLIEVPRRSEAGRAPDGKIIEQPFFIVEHTFHLAKASTMAADNASESR